MKLQLRFSILDSDNSKKKVTKTFSNINENATNDQFKEFAQSYTSLMDVSGLEVYIITVAEI